MLRLHYETLLPHFSQNILFQACIKEVNFSISVLELPMKPVFLGSSWLVGFNGISTSIGYLMPEPIYTYIIYMICKCKCLDW